MNGNETKRETLETVEEEWLSAKSAFDAARKTLEAVRQEIDNLMGTVPVAYTDTFVISLPVKVRQILDSKALRHDLPEVADKYTKEAVYRELSIALRNATSKVA